MNHYPTPRTGRIGREFKRIALLRDLEKYIGPGWSNENNIETHVAFVLAGACPVEFPRFS